MIFECGNGSLNDFLKIKEKYLFLKEDFNNVKLFYA